MIQESREKSIQDVREPKGDRRRERIRMDKHLAEFHEKDIREADGDTEGDVPSDPSPPFPGRKRNADDRQDEGGERHGEPVVLFNLGIHDILVSPLSLGPDWPIVRLLR